jgi:4-amino-4-deoxy-L-arabinose transferase-like glycosyltransferase
MQGHRRHWVLAGILIVAALARLPGLEAVPPPLNQDEASRGYDAWAILETGADRHGQRWPLFLESFGPGDYTAALSTYITVPFVAILGPTTAAMRLPDALLGVLTVLMLFVWLERQTDARVALLASAVLALSPWHIALTRTAHESGYAPFFLAVAMAGLHRSGLISDDAEDWRRGGRAARAWAMAAGLALGAHAWVYPATRLFTPLFLVAIAFIYRRRLLSMVGAGGARVTLGWGLAGLLIGCLPLLVTMFSHPEYLAARARAALLFAKQGTALQMAVTLAANYASNLDPRYLFLNSDDMSGILIEGVGQQLLVVAPFALIGLIRVIVGVERQAWSRLLAAWLILYPVPAAICADWNPHPMRTVGGMILFPILAATGIDWTVSQGRRLGRALKWVAGGAAVAAVLANTVQFGRAYYGNFRLLSRAGYQAGLVEAVRQAAALGDDADFILVTNRCNQAYVYALLYQPIDPKTLATTPQAVAGGRLGFHQVLRIGKYYFVPKENPEAVRRFQDEWSQVPCGAEGLVIDVVERGAAMSGQPLGRFPAGDPRVAGDMLELRRWRKSE